jgi:hypothetical protein
MAVVAFHSKAASHLATYQGTMRADFLLAMLKQSMRGRRRPLFSLTASLPALQGEGRPSPCRRVDGKPKLLFGAGGAGVRVALAWALAATSLALPTSERQ